MWLVGKGGCDVFWGVEGDKMSGSGMCIRDGGLGSKEGKKRTHGSVRGR